VVALDGGGVAQTGFDYVGVNCTLRKVVHLADFFAFLLEHADKFLADDLALALRLRNAGKFGKESLLRVHADKVDVPFAEGLFHLVALVFAQQSVVDENAGELISHSFGYERRGHGGIHAA